MTTEENNRLLAQKVNRCPEIPFFGADYPDATCIEGFLWDSDSYEDGLFTSGGNIPCPFCNTEKFIERHLDEPYMNREDILESIKKWRLKYS